MEEYLTGNLVGKVVNRSLCRASVHVAMGKEIVCMLSAIALSMLAAREEARRITRIIIIAEPADFLTVTH